MIINVVCNNDFLRILALADIIREEYREAVRTRYAKMLQDLFWAMGYNVIAIPLAAVRMSLYGHRRHERDAAAEQIIIN